jgi:hypothetical protein
MLLFSILPLLIFSYFLSAPRFQIFSIIFLPLDLRPSFTEAVLCILSFTFWGTGKVTDNEIITLTKTGVRREKALQITLDMVMSVCVRVICEDGPRKRLRSAKL